MVIDPHQAQRYDDVDSDPWPEMLEALAVAGARRISGFRRGAHVVHVGRFHPDVETVIGRIDGSEVAQRWDSALDGVVTTRKDGEGRDLTAAEIYHQD